MEQRNGRIDRHGQKGFSMTTASRVFVYHFVGQGYKDRERRNFSESAADLEADLEFLMRVARKIETIREDLGKVGPVIAEHVEEAMLGRRSTLNTAQAEKEAEPVRKMLKFERDLAKQIKALLDQYHETQKELRLSPENIRKVVEVALELAGQPAADSRVNDGWPVCLPATGLEGQLGGVCRRLDAPPHQGHPPHRLRPCLGRGTGRRGAGPSEPPAGPDEPAAVAGRSLDREPQGTEPDHGQGRAGPFAAASGHHCPRPAGRHRRRQPPAPRGDHHGGRVFIKEGKFSRMKVGESKTPWPQRPTRSHQRR